MSATGVYVQLLGRPRAVIGEASLDFVADKRYALLAYLAYSGEGVSREQLAYLFWPDVPSATAHNSLRQLLRRVLALPWPPGLATSLEIERYRLAWPVATDVAAFSSALHGGELERALGLYGGVLLEGFGDLGASEFGAWLELERDHLSARWRDTSLAQAQRWQDASQTGKAREVLRALLAFNALDEEVVQAYMRAAARAGQAPEALRAYQAFHEALDEAFGLAPTASTQALMQEILRGELKPAAQGETARVEDSSFVGREQETDRIVRLLAREGCRLLTLLGPGGVGKTRLARRAAAVLEGHFGMPVFVALEAVTSPEHVAAAIAAALGAELRGAEDSRAQLVTHIGARKLLVVLDNFEHLMASGALLSNLLEACAGLSLLVTSRERLDLLGEQLLPIAGLPYPLDPEVALEEALASDALRLLTLRVRRLRPDFVPTRADLPGLLRICRLVEGLPLGLELAAVWLRMMTSAEVAEEIAGNLEFLSATTRDLPARHRSLKATFESSWALLTPAEQGALRRLSVFWGSFSREAALSVAGAGTPLLGALLDKSLLRLSPSGRYDRHPQLHRFTREKLATVSEEEAQTKAAHGRFFASFLRRWAAELRGPQGRRALEAIELEIDNLRLIWPWLGPRSEALEQAAEALRKVFAIRGRLLEGIDFFAQAVADFAGADDAKDAKAALLVPQAWLCSRLGRTAEAVRLAKRALALLEANPDREALGVSRLTAMSSLGYSAQKRGDYPSADAHYRSALEVARSQGDPAGIAQALSELSALEQIRGRYEEASRCALEARTLFTTLGDQGGLAWSLGYLGLIALRRGRPEEALALLQEALGRAEASGERLWAPIFLAQLGLASSQLGDHARAEAALRRGLSLVEREQGLGSYLEPWLLADFAQVTLAAGREGAAAEHLARALALALRLDLPPAMLSALVGVAELWKEGDPARALALAALVLEHPASEHAHRERARRLLAPTLARPEPQGALARAPERALGEVARDVLARLDHVDNAQATMTADP